MSNLCGRRRNLIRLRMSSERPKIMNFRLFALALFGAAPLAGSVDQSTLDPAGPAAHILSNLGWFTLITSMAVAAVMYILIALVVTRPKGTLDEHAPADAGGGLSWIHIGGFLIPVLILTGILSASVAGMSQFPVHDGMNTSPDIRIIGHQWWWQVEYVDGPVDTHAMTANEIHIPAGRPVDIDLDSADVIHSFWVPQLHGKVDLIPGKRNRIRIQAARPGIYHGQCAEYCGAQHAHMILIVVAQTPEDYQAWLARQRSDAAPPVTTQQIEGQQLFLGKACALCHSVRGTLALGNVGPDLTHMGSRLFIAANYLPNNEANLEAWVTHAQSLKPACAMPNITQFTGTQLRALTAYLRNLK